MSSKERSKTEIYGSMAADAPTTCTQELASGPRAGEPCGKPAKGGFAGEAYCRAHSSTREAANHARNVARIGAQAGHEQGLHPEPMAGCPDCAEAVEAARLDCSPGRSAEVRGIMAGLERAKANWAEAQASYAKAAQSETPWELLRALEWGTGAEAAIKYREAQGIEATADFLQTPIADREPGASSEFYARRGDALAAAYAYARTGWRTALLDNRYRGGSTSPWSNALDATKREVLSNLARDSYGFRW